MKRFKKLSMFLASVVLASSLWAIRTDIISLQGIPDAREVDAFTVDSDGDINLYQGDIQLGQSGSTPSTTANTYPGFTVPIYNASGVSIPLGSVIIASTTNNSTAGYGTIENVGSTTTVLGVAYEIIAAGAVGDMTIAGYALCLTTGPVFIGNVLVSSAPNASSARGYAGADATPTTGADIGVALSARTDGGLTLTRLR